MAKKKFYRPLLYGVFVALRGFFRCLPYRFGFAFAGFVGQTAFHLVPRERQKTLEHLADAFPRLSQEQLRAIGARTFRHYGYMAAELALVERSLAQLSRLVSFTGREHLDRALAQGKGVIAVTAHFGNWEVLGGSLSLSGYPGSVVARRLYYEPYDRRLVRLRAKMNLETIYREHSARPVLRALKQNRVVGFVADHAPEAPVRFALKTGAPLVPLFIIREGMRHRIVIEPLIELSETGDKERDVAENTARWVAVQERYVRRYPHLWVWNHRRPLAIQKTFVPSLV